MSLIANEILKLRRTHLWTVILGLPATSVGLGALNYMANQDALSRGWTSLWSQYGLFHGLLFLTLAIAVLASAVWRQEHRGNNWNLLLTSPRSISGLLGAKIAVLGGLVLVMQLVFVVLGITVGTVLGVSEALPWSLPAAAMVTVLPAVAVAAWQSLLSMVIRNFAAPVGVALLASVVSAGVVGSQIPGVTYLLPPALVFQTSSLGSAAVADAGALSASAVMGVAVASTLLAALAWGLAVALVRTRDVRAASTA